MSEVNKPKDDVQTREGNRSRGGTYKSQFFPNLFKDYGKAVSFNACIQSPVVRCL